MRANSLVFTISITTLNEIADYMSLKPYFLGGKTGVWVNTLYMMASLNSSTIIRSNTTSFQSRQMIQFP